MLEVSPDSESLGFCDDERRELDRNLITNNGETWSLAVLDDGTILDIHTREISIEDIAL